MILIVPVLNRYDLLERMMNSIDHRIDHLLIIDNGASEEFNQVINFNVNIVNHTVLRMPSNLGVAASWNLGIKLFPFEDYWAITSADTVFQPGALKALAEASTSDSLTLTAAFPHYQAFSVGSELVDKVGLFDESIYPIYFEDNDYQRRVEHHGFEIKYVVVPVQHDNSSTIHSDPHYSARNSQTFTSNAQYFADKVNRNDYSEGRWSISRVRNNSWHK